MGRTMFEVQCLMVQSQKCGVRDWFAIDEHVWVCSMFEKMMVKSVEWVI